MELHKMEIIKFHHLRAAGRFCGLYVLLTWMFAIIAFITVSHYKSGFVLFQMLEKVRNLRDQPCCGYFLQGAVRAVAILDIGISLFAMILIASEVVRKFQDWTEMKKIESMKTLYYVRAVLWSSYFAVMIVIVGLSVFLFKTARRRNGGMCKLWIFLSIAANSVLCASAITTQVLFPINPVILVFVFPYAGYKAYCIYVVASFVREIKSYGGFNACLSGLTDSEVEDFERGHPPEVNEMRDELQKVKSQAFNKDFEVPIDCLEIDENAPLGSGAFGTVYRAKLVDDVGKLKGEVSSNKMHRSVAVKTVHHNADPAYFKTLLGELKIMTFLPPHENVVNLIGACTSQIKDKRLYIVVEFCPFGNLHDYLKARRGLFVNYVKDGDVVKNKMSSEEYKNFMPSNNVTTCNLIQWCYDTAKGLEFLEQRKVIHGDLAARNLLLGNGKRIKITDFGLSKKLYQYNNYVTKEDKLLPWRWMAIESLRDMKFSSKSDVWSFGVTIWEVFSLAEIPFPGFSWNIDFIGQILDGLRMKQPPNCPDFMYDIMLKTWHVFEEERPTFTEIKECLEEKYISQGLGSCPSSETSEPSSSQGYCTIGSSSMEEVEVYIGNISSYLGTGAESSNNTTSTTLSSINTSADSSMVVP